MFCAVWISVMIFARALCVAGLSTRTFTSPQRFNVPPKIAAPGSFVIGIASPVSVDSSVAVRPEITVPSTAKSSSGFTTITSPTRSAETVRSSVEPSGSSTCAIFGAALVSALISRCVR